MNNNNKDFMRQLSNLDDSSVEEIAEKYPALRKRNKKRILRQCMKKTVFFTNSDSAGEEGIVISGTERYKRKYLYRFAASAAALVLAVGGITSVLMLNKNLIGKDDIETQKISSESLNDYLSNNSSNKTTTTLHNDDYNDTQHNADSKGSDSAVNSNAVPLSGTYWYEHELNGSVKNSLEFNNDGFSGNYIIPPYDITTADAEKISFTYEQNVNEISFRIGSDTAAGKLSFDAQRQQTVMTLIWSDGETEYFYNSEIPITAINNGNENQTPQASTVNNSNNSVSQNTTPTSSLPKTFLNGLYYVEISGVNGYMGFDFKQDGTLTKYNFDNWGDVVNSSIAATNYEITGTHFSYGDLNSELNKKNGTIINQNGSSSFTAQFDDGSLYMFSTERPQFQKPYSSDTKPDSLNGTIWSHYGDRDPDDITEYIEKRKIEFKEDGVSGTAYIVFYPHVAAKTERIEIPFTYEINGDEITFHMESSPYTMVKAELLYGSGTGTYGLDVEYSEADKYGNSRKCFAQSGSLDY